MSSFTHQDHDAPPPLPQGLRGFPAMIIVPMMEIAWTLYSISTGIVYFQEYENFTVLSSLMFALGVTVSAQLPHVLPWG